MRLDVYWDFDGWYAVDLDRHDGTVDATPAERAFGFGKTAEDAIEDLREILAEYDEAQAG
jgi:RecB family exonuclease